MRTRHVIAIAALAVLGLAGCGGGSTGASSTTGTQAADLVGAQVLALISLNTDREGDQWRQADELLSRFPGRAKLLAQVRSELQKEGLDWERDIAPALGPEVDVALAYQQGQSEPDMVALLKPEDSAKLQALARKADTPLLTRELKDGWWALSDTQVAFGRVLAAEGVAKLADEQAFQDSTTDQPDESLVEAYVNGSRLRELVPASLRRQLGAVPLLDSLGGIVASIQALDEGVKLAGAASGAGEQAKTFTSTFLDEVPSGALLFATFDGSSLNLAQAQTSPMAAQVEQLVGVPLADLAQLLQGEVAIYVRPATLIPEITLVAKTSDEARAKATLDKLAQKLTSLTGGKTTTVQAGGLTYTQIPIQQLNVSYAVGNGRIVITDLPAGAAKLGSGPSMADDEDFKAAADAAGLPDETTGLVYVNVADAIAVVDAFAGALPQDARANLQPLRSLLLFGGRDGDKATVGGFLGIGQ